MFLNTSSFHFDVFISYDVIEIDCICSLYLFIILRDALIRWPSGCCRLSVGCEVARMRRCRRDRRHLVRRGTSDPDHSCLGLCSDGLGSLLEHMRLPALGLSVGLVSFDLNYF